MPPGWFTTSNKLYQWSNLCFSIRKATKQAQALGYCIVANHVSSIVQLLSDSAWLKMLTTAVQYHCTYSPLKVLSTHRVHLSCGTRVFINLLPKTAFIKIGSSKHICHQNGVTVQRQVWHGTDNCHTWSNSTTLTNPLRVIKKLYTVSFCILLGAYYSSSLANYMPLRFIHSGLTTILVRYLLQWILQGLKSIKRVM